MTHARRSWLLLALALGWAPTASPAEVIANAAYPDDAISRPLLRGVFGMRVRAWPDGTAVRVYVLADDNPVHQEFCKGVLRMYPYQLRHNWDRLMYSGTGQPPVTVTSEEELLLRVAETPGAVGYLAERPTPDTGRKTAANVKVLDVR